MKFLKLSKLYKKKKKDNKDTPENNSDTSNPNNLTKVNENAVDSNNLRKTKTIESRKKNSDNDENSVDTRSYMNTKEKNKHSSTSMKSYNTYQHDNGILDSDISDSDDAKQESNKYQYSKKDIRPIMNSKRPPQQHRQYPSYKISPDTNTTSISNNGSKVSINDPVIARMQDRHRNQVKMAALRKQQMLIEEEEQRLSSRPLYSPLPQSIPASPSTSPTFNGNSSFYIPHHHHHQQQQPLSPIMMPYMVLSPYPPPMMDPYIYHNQIRPFQTDTSSQASFVSLPAALHPNQHSLYKDQEDSRTELDSVVNARTRSASVLPTLTKTKAHERGLSSSQSSSDTELSTPSKESFSKEFTALYESENDDEDEDRTDADFESNNEDGPTKVGKLRQKNFFCRCNKYHVNYTSY